MLLTFSERFDFVQLSHIGEKLDESVDWNASGPSYQTWNRHGQDYQQVGPLVAYFLEIVEQAGSFFDLDTIDRLCDD